MNLLQTIRTIEEVAKGIPNVHTVVSAFEDLNREDTVYSAVIIQQQSHTHNDDWMQYNFYIGYADRLVEDGSNELSVQSTAMNNIHSIVRTLRNILPSAEISYSNTNVFTQRFISLCAGAYETVSIILPISECDDSDYEGIPGLDALSTTITENGDYNFVPAGLGFDSVHVVVDVQPEVSLEERSISISENGQVVVTTTPGFTGMSKVNINVAVPQEGGYKEGYDEGYSKGHQEGVNEGYADGVATQKSKLQDITITENGTYDREDGYKHIVVDVPASAEAEGHTININENGTFTYAPQEGVVWNSVTVIANVPTEGGYQEGYEAGYAAGKADGKAEGIAEQKAKLASIEITENGTYEKEDGYNRVVVNVESPVVNLQEKTTNPATTTVEVTPDLGFDGLSKVTVHAVTSNIDPNIVPGNIKTGVTVLGVEGTLKVEKPEERFNVQPSTVEQTITPTEGKVFSGGTVKAVTSTIDSNIQPENIKQGVTILGVEGSHKGEKPEERFNVQPSTVEQTITPTEGKVFSRGTVRAVTSTIDSNIQPENIKQGVAILGIVGTLSESGGGDPDYHYMSGGVDRNGLRALGWTEEDILRYEQNTPHYPWQNDLYTVSEENKALYGLNDPKPDSYKNDPTVTFVPNKNMDTYFNSGTFEGMKYIKGLPFYNCTRTDITGMFKNCSNLTTIPLLNTSNVTSMWNMFEGCSNLATVPLLNTSNVTDMCGMFKNCSSLTTIPQLDTSKVTHMGSMFSDCSSLITIPLLNTSNVTSMGSMFYFCDNITTIPLLDTSNVTSMGSMFNNCTSLTSIPQLNTSNVTGMEYMFKNCSSLTTIPQLNTSNVTDMSSMFYNCRNLTAIPRLDTSKVTDMNNMLYYCRNLTAIPQMDTSSVTDMKYMFYYCDGLTTIPLFNTQNVWDMNHMFYECASLTTIPQLNTSNVIDMRNMFEHCASLTTIPQLDTSKVTKMDYMFASCIRLTKVPQLDTSKVTSMKYMFAGCQSLDTVEGIDFSGLTSELTNLFGYRNYTQPRITRFIVNGKINVDMSDEYSIKKLTEIDYDSVKSILTAASLTDNTYAKTLAFNRKMTDQNGELKSLVSSCTRKGWRITGLTLQ